jgi:hypothetical protein
LQQLQKYGHGSWATPLQVQSKYEPLEYFRWSPVLVFNGLVDQGKVCGEPRAFLRHLVLLGSFCKQILKKKRRKGLRNWLWVYFSLLVFWLDTTHARLCGGETLTW